MSVHSNHTHAEPDQGYRRDDAEAPDYVAHWVVKTARSQEMIAWYKTVFGARVVHEDPKLAFLNLGPRKPQTRVRQSPPRPALPIPIGAAAPKVLWRRPYRLGLRVS
jgi:hypothetical protein